MRFHKLFAQTAILPTLSLSISQVARIIGKSHWHPTAMWLFLKYSQKKVCRKGPYGKGKVPELPNLALREWNECCEDADMKGSLCYLPFFP
jgi:hypothetical protein